MPNSNDDDDVAVAFGVGTLLGIAIASVPPNLARRRRRYGLPPAQQQGPRLIGPAGARGERGPMGLSGAKGDVGLTGPKGDKGDAGLPGPKGDAGMPGPKGDKGDKGDAGLPGPKGDKGDMGDQGDTGLTGPKGEKGDTGLTGPKGDTGLTGPKGDTGDTGLTGPKGDKGDKGDTGLTGPKGDKGDTGLTGPKGDKGDTGLTGPKGDKGDTGAPGPAGPSGPASPTQDIQLCASAANTLIPQGMFGVDGDVQTQFFRVAADICRFAGTLSDWWLEGQSVTSGVTITILKAPKTGSFPTATPVTLTVPSGQNWTNSSATLLVQAGDRISAIASAAWNHGGLTLRARLT